MTVCAAIFDVYGTLLEVGPAPPDAEEQWRRVWQDMLRVEPRFSRFEFSIACSRIIGRQHEIARGRGIPYPEIHWPSIVIEAVPELRDLSKSQQQEFLLRQIRTDHSTRLTAQTAAALRTLKATGCLLGIASNAQAYTLRELEEGLEGHGLGLDTFEPDLCFWSYQHGFSKPDSHVFQLLSARLQLRGVSASQTLMIGDRADNDVEPAKLHGWQTWQLCAPGQRGNGDWEELLAGVIHPDGTR